MSGYHKRSPEPFPVQKLRRVDRPTTVIHDSARRRRRQATNNSPVLRAAMTMALVVPSSTLNRVAASMDSGNAVKAAASACSTALGT